MEQPIQKVQSDPRCGCVGIVGNRQMAPHNSRSALNECSVQRQCAVGYMNPIPLRREVRHLCFQFQHFQNVGDLPGNIVHGTEFQLDVNLPTQRERASVTRPSGVKKAPFAKMILRSCRNSSQNRASLMFCPSNQIGRFISNVLPFFPTGQPLPSFPCHIVLKESNLTFLHHLVHHSNPFF